MTTNRVANVEDQDGGKVVTIVRGWIEKDAIQIVGRVEKDRIRFVGEPQKERLRTDARKVALRCGGVVYCIAVDEGCKGEWEKVPLPDLLHRPRFLGRPGDRWVATWKGITSRESINTLGHWEWVRVKAGDFYAVKLDMEFYENGRLLCKSTIWVAPNIGRVKSTTDGELDYELLSITEGKP